MKYALYTFLLVSYAASAQEQCFKLTDADAPFRKIKMLLPDFDIDQVVSQLQPILPFLPPKYESCIASYDMSTAAKLSNLFKPNGACEKIAGMQSPSEYFGNVPRNVINLPKYATYLRNMSNEKFKNMCVPLTENIIPCLKELNPVLTKLMSKNANGCCKGIFEKEMPTPSLIIKLVIDAGNAICRMRSPGFDGAKEQTCGYTLVQVLADPSVLQVVKNVFAGLHIPNQQACNAFLGKPYNGTDTIGRQLRLGNEAEGITVGSCSQYLGETFSTLRKLTTQNPNLSLMFGDNTCLSGEILLAPITKNFHPLLTNIFNLVVAKRACIHLPSGFGPCN